MQRQIEYVAIGKEVLAKGLDFAVLLHLLWKLLITYIDKRTHQNSPNFTKTLLGIYEVEKTEIRIIPKMRDGNHLTTD